MGKRYGEMLWGNVIGKCYGKFYGGILWGNFIGKCYGKILRKMLWGNFKKKYCGKIMCIRVYLICYRIFLSVKTAKT
jgi:hypothetical protein